MKGRFPVYGFGLREFGVRRIEDRLGYYLDFVYMKGVRPKVQGKRQENHVLG